MIKNEELLSDERFVRFSTQHQSEIISLHCGEIEERIRTASTRLEAELGSAEACLQFEKECPSTLVKQAMTRRVENLIIQYWGSKK
jgi:hypothetical protein